MTTPKVSLIAILAIFCSPAILQASHLVRQDPTADAPLYAGASATKPVLVVDLRGATVSANLQASSVAGAKPTAYSYAANSEQLLSLTAGESVTVRVAYKTPIASTTATFGAPLVSTAGQPPAGTAYKWDEYQITVPKLGPIEFAVDGKNTDASTDVPFKIYVGPGSVAALSASELAALSAGYSSTHPVMVVDIRRQVAQAWMTRFNSLVGLKLTDRYMTSSTGDATKPSVTLVPNQLVTLKVVFSGSDSGDPTVTFPVATDVKPISPNDTTVPISGGAKCNVYEILVPTTKAVDLDVKQTLASGSKDTPNDFDLQIGPAKAADFSTQVSVLSVISHDSPPQFGIRIPTYSLSSKITFDGISTYSGGGSSTATTTLGGAFTYVTLIGTSFEPTAHTIFGFPAMITFSLGFKGITFGQNVNGGGSHSLFFGIGISIPTGKLQSTSPAATSK